MGMLSQALSSGENNSPGVARRQGVIQPRQLFARRATPGGNRLHAFGGRVSVTAILAHA